MFGRSPAVVVDSYSRRRTRKGIPGWLWLLLAGIVLGAAGVILAQQRWPPPGLNAQEAARLGADLAEAERERARLQIELGAAQQRLQQARDSCQVQVDAATRACAAAPSAAKRKPR